MSYNKIGSFLLAVMIGLATVLISLGVLGMMSPALALEQAGTKPMHLDPPAQPPPPNDDDLVFIAFFTDDVSIDIMDLSGNPIGEGEHGGMARCNRNNCSQKTHLSLDAPLMVSPEYEYRFTSRQVIDPEEKIVIVAGTGTKSSRSQKERFSFVATFEDNEDDTVKVTYEASIPDASFIVPEAPGTFEIESR